MQVFQRSLQKFAWLLVFLSWTEAVDVSLLAHQLPSDHVAPLQLVQRYQQLVLTQLKPENVTPMGCLGFPVGTDGHPNKECIESTIVYNVENCHRPSSSHPFDTVHAQHFGRLCRRLVYLIYTWESSIVFSRQVLSTSIRLSMLLSKTTTLSFFWQLETIVASSRWANTDCNASRPFALVSSVGVPSCFSQRTQKSLSG